MNNIVLLAQREAHGMDRQALRAAKAGEPIVRQTAAPHDLAHRIQIACVRDHGGTVCDHDAKHGFCQLHGRFVPLNRVKVALKRVHHDIGHAAGHLPPGKRRGKGRVHDGKGRAIKICVEAALLQNGLVGQHSRVARLAAGGRDGQDHANGR